MLTGDCQVTLEHSGGDKVMAAPSVLLKGKTLNPIIAMQSPPAWDLPYLYRQVISKHPLPFSTVLIQLGFVPLLVFKI